MPSFVQSPTASRIDATARRYGKTPSQLLGIVDKNGNPDRYYGLMIDMALAEKFKLIDKDEKDNYMWELKQYILSIGRALGAKYPSSAKGLPISNLERLKRAYKKELGKKAFIPKALPTQEELMKKWNIKVT